MKFKIYLLNVISLIIVGVAGVTKSYKAAELDNFM